MPAKFVTPTLDEYAFTCPNCETLCTHSKFQLKYVIGANTLRDAEGTWRTRCSNCKHDMLWQDNQIVFPATTAAPLAHPDLPSDLAADFEEARTILNASPRGACGLLRYIIDRLTIDLGGNPKHSLNDRIAYLVREKGLAPQAQQALDSVRVIGSNAVHPLEMDLRDDVELATKLFALVNGIVEDTITRPAAIAKIYAALPPKNIEAIKKRDG